jgi:hypothetical protein
MIFPVLSVNSLRFFRKSIAPFALLDILEVNDAAFVNASDSSLKIFRVYANELIDPDGI